MEQYLKIFKTENEYEASAEKPTIAHIVEDVNIITEKPIEHDYVEIGGVKWATMNIGASSITDTGLYFQWGDTQGYTAEQCGSGEGKKYFGWADYKYCTGGTEHPVEGNIVKYNHTDGKTTLDAEDDAVTAAWGGGWRMPTTEEFVALGAAVNSAWTDNYNNSGVAGIICTDKTDSSKVLFFPAAGTCGGGTKGTSNYYHSSTISSDNIMNCKVILFTKNYSIWNTLSYRSTGRPVRGVLV